ncbi:MAG: hypothetical protein EB020_09240 [Proteobacteria bacterium]|nr:hypothetical protein [Pseudomonadota bacterium]
MSWLDPADLHARLRGFEWDDLEAKLAATGIPSSAYASVSAFANTSGGCLVFGVQDVGGRLEVVGVGNPDAAQNDFVSTCRSAGKFSVPVDVRTAWLDIDGKIVLAFAVPPSGRHDRPVRVREDRTWHAYVRVAGGDYRCTPREEARFLRDADATPFDTVIEPDSDASMLDPRSLRWLQATIRGRRATTVEEGDTDTVDPSEWLDRFGLAVDGQLTRAALLLCGTPASRLRIKPTPIVDVRVYATRSDDPVSALEWIDRLVCDGNVVQALIEVIARLERLVPNPFALESDGVTRRAHGPHLPVLREAIVNLLTHQDYGDPARTATIRWFHDRIVFDNPGDSLLTPAEMRHGGSSASRNPLVQRMMRLTGFAEHAGLGVPTMRSRLADQKHFRTAYLRPALVSGLVEMTDPTRPRSSHQRYRLTAAGKRCRAAMQLPSPAGAGEA